MNRNGIEANANACVEAMTRFVAEQEN